VLHLYNLEILEALTCIAHGCFSKLIPMPFMIWSYYKELHCPFTKVVTLDVFRENRFRKTSVGRIWTSARLDACPRRLSAKRPQGGLGSPTRPRPSDARTLNNLAVYHHNYKFWHTILWFPSLLR
jgi:hypothetical protein